MSKAPCLRIGRQSKGLVGTSVANTACYFEVSSFGSDAQGLPWCGSKKTLRWNSCPTFEDRCWFFQEEPNCEGEPSVLLLTPAKWSFIKRLWNHWPQNKNLPNPATGYYTSLRKSTERWPRRLLLLFASGDPHFLPFLSLFIVLISLSRIIQRHTRHTAIEKKGSCYSISPNNV